jgi:hypothetical protein
MSIDLNKLVNKLDEALSNETTETLTKFLKDKRMSNNKQSSVDWLVNFFETGVTSREEWLEAKEKAKAIHKEENYQSWCKGREKLIEENRSRNNGEIVSCADFYKDSKNNFEEWYNETFTEKKQGFVDRLNN